MMLLIIIIVAFSIVKFVNPAVISVSVDKWYNGAKGAYSLIHDDLALPDCYGIVENADTIAYNRGVKFGTGVVVGEMTDSLWQRVKTLVAHGHEVFPHSWSHGAAVELGWTPKAWNNDSDIVLSKKIIEDSLGVDVGFFIFPFDAYDDAALSALKKAGYLGARAGKKMYEDRGINSGDSSYDPFRTEFDAYMSKEGQDSITAAGEDYFVSIYEDDSGSVAIQHLDSSISKGGWGVQELHNVGDIEPLGWGSVTIADYRALLDHAVAKRKEGVLWLETPSVVTKYIVTRNSVGTPTLDKRSFSFSGTHDSKYLTPLTLTITTKNSPNGVKVITNDGEIEAKKIDSNCFRVELKPTQKNYEITFIK